MYLSLEVLAIVRNFIPPKFFSIEFPDLPSPASPPLSHSEWRGRESVVSHQEELVAPVLVLVTVDSTYWSSFS